MRALSRINLLCIFFIVGCASLSATRYPTLRLAKAHPFGATALAYNHDGNLLATGGFYGEVRLWHMPDGAALLSLPGNQETVRSIIWIDDNSIVSATEDGTITAWDLRNKEVTRRLVTTSIITLARIPNTLTIVVACKNGVLRTYAYPALTLIAEHNLNAAVRALAVNDDGKSIAVATNDKQVRLFDPQLRMTQSLTPAPRNVLSLRFSPDSQQLAAGTWFKLLFWDLVTGQQSMRDTEHFGAIISIDYTPDGKDLVSLGRISDSSLRLTDVATGQVLSRMAPLPLCGWMVRVSPDGHYTAAGSESGDVQVFDLLTPQLK